MTPMLRKIVLVMSCCGFGCFRGLWVSSTFIGQTVVRARQTAFQPLMTAPDDADMDGENLVPPPPTTKTTGDVTNTISQSQSPKLPLRLSHSATVCMVPPPLPVNDSLPDETWELFTRARTILRDPGLYRWPPHANLLYPFVWPHARNKEENNDSFEPYPNDLPRRLRSATAQCEPFRVSVNQLGCFGGRHRGVLWADPESFHDKDENEEREAPLIRLQRLLVEAFPECAASSSSSSRTKFRPHMTLSHFASLEDAETARAKLIETEVWSNTTEKSFWVDRIYLLTRRGDDGQFQIAATLALGQRNEGDDGVTWHSPPVPFPAMPTVEEEWVREERMKLKKRRNRRGRGRGRRNREQRSDTNVAMDNSQSNNRDDGWIEPDGV